MPSKDQSIYVFEDFEDIGLEPEPLKTEEEPLGKCVIYQGTKNYLKQYSEEWNRCNSGPEIEQFKSKVTQQVRALTARWLRMQNLCVLAGAGTAVCVGGLKGNELFEMTKGILSLKADQASTKLLLQLLTLCDTKSVNFEDFLSYLCAAKRVAEPSTLSFKEPLVAFIPTKSASIQVEASALSDLIDDIEKAIGVLCNLTLPEQTIIEMTTDKRLTAHLTFIGKVLSRDPSLGRVKLATTNYDTLFEQALDRLNTYYADGFTGTVDRHFNHRHSMC
jgi:hypothetical protein